MRFFAVALTLEVAILSLGPEISKAESKKN
jgi:hypothetical protein